MGIGGTNSKEVTVDDDVWEKSYGEIGDGINVGETVL
jgi:hypothetical protein